MNLLTDTLPHSLTINGEEYAIHTGFRSWIQFELLMFDRSIPLEEKVVKLLTLCFIDLPPTLPEALTAMIRFYAGCSAEPEQSDKKQEDGGTSAKPIYSFEFDADYIYAAFLTQYKIDLQTADLHWWQFKSLFKSLDDNNKICKIMEYRAIDLSQIKDKEQKKFYRKMKALYRLPDLRSEEEKEKAMIESMSSLF